MKKVLSYDDYSVADLSAVVVDWGGNISASPNMREVGGSSPVFVGSRLDARRFQIHVDCTGLSPTLRRARMQEILGIVFDERSLDEEHRLIVLMDDGATTTYRDVSVAGRPMIHESGLTIDLQSARQGWYNLATRTTTQQFTAAGSMAIGHRGKAISFPTYRIRWLSQRSGSSGDVGYKYEQVWQITNNETSIMKNECILISLGDTRTLVSGGKAKSNGEDVHVWAYGKELGRNLVNWNTRLTHCWVTIPEIATDQSFNLSVVYGNPTSSNAKRLIPGRTEPAFAIYGCNNSIYGVHSSGTNGFNNRLYFSGSSFGTDMWVGGTVQVWDSSGANNQSKSIISSGANYVETSSSWTVNPTSSWSYVLYMSINSSHIYVVARTGDRGGFTNDGQTTNPRGGWYLDNGRGKPHNIRFADFIPGAWSRALIQKNEDRYAQVRYSWLEDQGVGTGSDRDAFAIFDATRAVSDAHRRPEDGQYDSVMLTSIHGIDFLIFNRIFFNPIRTSHLPTEGIAQYKVLAQGKEGGEDWDVILEDGASRETWAITGTSTFNPLSSTVGYTPNHIAFSIWGRDKEGNDAPVTETVSRKKLATAQWGDRLSVGIDTTNWSVVRTVSERSAYDLNTELRLNGGSITPFAPYDKLVIGGRGRRMMLNTAEILAYDTATGLAEVRAEADDDFIESVPYAAMPYHYDLAVDGSVVQSLERTAMTLNVDFTQITNGSFLSSIAGWVTLSQVGGSSVSFIHHPEEGGFARISIALNTAAVDQRIIWVYNTTGRFPVVPRRRYRLTGMVRGLGTSQAPALGIAFAPTSTATPGDPIVPVDWSIPLSNVWYQRQVQVKAPSNARYAYAAIGVICKTAGGLNSYDFTDIEMADVLHIAEAAMSSLEVSVEYEEGWLE